MKYPAFAAVTPGSFRGLVWCGFRRLRRRATLGLPAESCPAFRVVLEVAFATVNGWARRRNAERYTYSQILFETYEDFYETDVFIVNDFIFMYQFICSKNKF